MLRRLYEWTMQKASGPRAEWWLAVFAFVEASFFPIPPHPVLGLMCLAAPKKALRYALVATAGSVLGGLLGYAIGYGLYESVGKLLIAALGLAKSFAAAQCSLAGNPWTVLLAFAGKGVTPIPFKLLTITAGFLHLNLGLFIVASVISRSISFLLVGVVFRQYGAVIKAWIDKNLMLAVGAFLAAVLAGFLAVSLLGGHKAKSSAPCVAAPVAQPA
jgi:membrane protein YqaA with SNARE-associated domain